MSTNLNCAISVYVDGVRGVFADIEATAVTSERTDILRLAVKQGCTVEIDVQSETYVVN